MSYRGISCMLSSKINSLGDEVSDSCHKQKGHASQLNKCIYPMIINQYSNFLLSHIYLKMHIQYESYMPTKWECGSVWSIIILSMNRSIKFISIFVVRIKRIILGIILQRTRSLIHSIHFFLLYVFFHTYDDLYLADIV